MRRWLSTLAAALIALPAWAGSLSLGYLPVPGPGEKPALLVTATKEIRDLQVVVEAGGRTYSFDAQGVAPNVQQRFEWTRDTNVTSAQAHVLAEFTDESMEEMVIPIEWSYGGGLTVDLQGATANVSERKLTVKVSDRVERAEIKAYGAHKALLDESEVPIGAGPGEISVPWVGSAADVVLLDVTLHNDSGWSGFTYSPWFLNIPHDDVHFASNSADIPPEEEPKLHATLAELQDVLDKYGEIVPVKLYIAGCTDTVGDAGGNMDLSRRRARAIATWLRQHGYSKPIYYHGFGESLLAVPTGDNVDSQSNRRALYMGARRLLDAAVARGAQRQVTSKRRSMGSSASRSPSTTHTWVGSSHSLATRAVSGAPTSAGASTASRRSVSASPPIASSWCSSDRS